MIQGKTVLKMSKISSLGKRVKTASKKNVEKAEKSSTYEVVLPKFFKTVKYTGEINEDMIDILRNKEGLYYFKFNELYIYDLEVSEKPRLINEGDTIAIGRSGLLRVL